MRINSLSLNNKSFKGSAGLSGIAKVADLFIKSQENLSSTRFIQDTATNWAPKAIFARSKADFAEMSFLEFTESAIFYFASPILGEKLFRNIFTNFSPKNIKNTVSTLIPKTVGEIVQNKAISENVKKQAISTKAGIVLACTAIPAAEYALSFAKNLFTLKNFKKSNFNNIANLDKNHNEKEDVNHQQKVEKSAKKHLKRFAVISAAGVIAGSALALFGHKSNALQKVSKGILNPGIALSKGLEKIGLKNEKFNNAIKQFSLDFSNDNGKLALSKGQLALTAILGLFGYSAAAQDRGKLDKAEVWTRVPLVVFYTIFGSELFEKGFHKILENKNKFKDVIKKSTNGKITTPLRKDLPNLAEKIAKEKGTNAVKELSRLTKEKAIIQGVPYAFSLLFMGLTLSGITRLWTQYRYNHQKKNGENNNPDSIQKVPYSFKSMSEFSQMVKNKSDFANAVP